MLRGGRAIRRPKYLLVAGIVAACALPVIFCAWRRTFAASGHDFKARCALSCKAIIPHARLLNHWNYGGLLIYYTRGAVPLFVDGRASTVYPDGLLRDYFTLTRHGGR